MVHGLACSIELRMDAHGILGEHEKSIRVGWGDGREQL